MDPVTYLSQGKFHRSIFCKRTHCRVSFALVGDWNDQHHYYYPQSTTADKHEKALILFVLPSGCSRYVGIRLDGLASSRKLRLLAIDRPGAGSNPSCLGVDRMKISTQQTLSVLDSIGYGSENRKIDIMTHSAGWLYALDLITEKPSLFSNTTRIAFCSPFVPTHCSGNMTLSLLPTSVVQLAPVAGTILSSCINGFNWSRSVFQDLGLGSTNSEDKTQSTEKQRRKERIRRKSKARYPKARFHPPYEQHLSLGLEAWKAAEYKSTIDAKSVLHPRTSRPLRDGESLLYEYFQIEGGLKAATEDFLFCLGKVQGMNNLKLEEWMKVKLSRAATILNETEGGAKSESLFVLVWGADDFLIPSKGQRYLETLFEQAKINASPWTMAEGGHDTPLGSIEVMGDIFRFLAG